MLFIHHHFPFAYNAKRAPKSRKNRTVRKGEWICERQWDRRETHDPSGEVQDGSPSHRTLWRIAPTVRRGRRKAWWPLSSVVIFHSMRQVQGISLNWCGFLYFYVLGDKRLGNVKINIGTIFEKCRFLSPLCLSPSQSLWSFHSLPSLWVGISQV